MANSHLQAITEAKEGIKLLKGELAEIHKMILQNAAAFKESFGDGDLKSFKDLNKLIAENNKLQKQNDTLKNKQLNNLKKSEIAEQRLAGIKLTNSKKVIDIENKKIAAQKRLDTEKQKALHTAQREKAANDKLSGAYAQLINKQKIAKTTLQNLTVSQGKNATKTKQAQLAYDKLTKKVNQANAATRNFAKGGLRNSVRGLTNLLGAFGFIGGVQLFADAISSAFQLTTALDSIGFSMRAVIKDSDELAQTQVFLTRITNDYGAELVTTTNRYIKFRAAAQQAGMSAIETQDIFGTMTKAAGVLGLKTDELTGIFLALEQMISKGKVTTEELRRQLGERLPGAMDIMATSLGVTTSELDRMLRAGEVITKDVLPAFARQVEISFGLDKVDKVVTLRAAITRLKNSWTILVDNFAKGGTQVQSLTTLLDHFAKNFKTYVTIIILGAKAFLLYKTMVLAATVQNKLFGKQSILTALRLKLLNKATITSTKSLARFNAVMKANVIGIVITALYLAYEALEFFNKPLGEATRLIKEQTEELKAQVGAYSQNREEVNKMASAYENLVEKGLERTNEETTEMERLFVALAKIAPEVVTDTDEFGVATAIATKKLKEFNVELKNSLLNRARFNISEQTKELAKYKEVQENIIKFQKDNFAINVDDVGWVIKKGDAYKKLSKNGATYTEITLKEKAAVSDYLLKVKEGIELSNKTIENNEDLIGTITGVLTERQKEAKALEAQKAGRSAYEEHTKNQTLLLPKLRKELVELKKELSKLEEGGLAVGEKEKFDDLKKSISDTEKQIKELTKASDDFLKGSITFYEKQISVAKEAIQNSTLSAKGYKKQSDAIENATEKIKELKKALGIREEASTIDLTPEGLDDGQDKLTKYQEDLISFLETLKETEEAPELMPLSEETQKRLEEYNKELSKTAAKLSDLDDMKEIFSEVTETFADIFDIDVSKFDFLFDEDKNKLEDWAKLSKELIGSVLDASLQRYDIELQTAQRTRDLIVNNDLETEEKKEAARNKFREEERRINTERAKQERQNSLIKIAVDTAVGIVSAMGSPLKIAAIIALGLTQAAIVASQPLPEFYDGVENSTYEGLATKDEKGAELHLDKKGRVKDRGQNKGAKLTNIEKGDTIFTAGETKSILNGLGSGDLQQAIFSMNMQSNGNILNENVVDKALLNEVGGLRKDIDRMGLRIEKMASRPINVNNKVEIKQDRAY